MKAIFDLATIALIAVMIYFLGFYNVLGPVIRFLRNLIL